MTMKILEEHSHRVYDAIRDESVPWYQFAVADGGWDQLISWHDWFVFKDVPHIMIEDRPWKSNRSKRRWSLWRRHQPLRGITAKQGNLPECLRCPAVPVVPAQNEEGGPVG
jgi:hypothetical protein